MRAGAVARAVVRSGVVLVIVLFVTLALLAAVPATELGTRGLAATIDWWAGDRVRIGEVSGRLTQTVHVRGLGIRHPSMDLTAAAVALSWDPAKLLDGEAYLTALTMDGVRLELHELPAAGGADPPAALAFGLSAPSFTVTDLTVVAGDEEIPIESVALSARLSKTQVTVADFTAAGAHWRLTANGAVGRVEPVGLNLQAQWMSHVDGAAQEGRLTITGDSRSLDFDGTMRVPFELETNGQVRRTPQGYAVATTGAWRNLRWPPSESPSVHSSEGHFKLDGGLDDLSLALDLDLATDDLPPTRFTVQGTGSVEPSASFPFELATRWNAVTASDATLSGEFVASGDRERAILRPTMLEPFAASAEAALELADEPSIDAVAQWSGLFWPLAGKPAITSREGRLEAKGGAARTELTLNAALDAPEQVHQGQVSANTTVAWNDELTVTGSFDWEGVLASHGARLGGTGTLSGNPSGVLRFTHALSAPFALSSAGKVSMDGAAPEIDIVSEWVDLRWPPDGPPALYSPHGSLEVHGGLEDFRAIVDARAGPAGGVANLHIETNAGVTAGDWHVDVEWRGRLADGYPLAGRGRIDGGTDQARLAHRLTVPFELSTEGVVDSPAVAPVLRLAGTWRDLHWPPDPSARYRSTTGSYTLNGPLDGLAVQLGGTLDAAALPPARFSLAGRLDDTGLDLDPLAIHTLGGRTQARGRIAWRPDADWRDVDWRFEVDARELDPGRRWPQWSGTLDGTAIVQGRMMEGIPHTTVDVQHLAGRVRDHPVEGHGTVEIAGERLRARGVSLRSGDNRLELDGVYDRIVDLEYSLEAADLSAVFPDAHGRLAGGGVVKGSIASPQVKMHLAGQNVRYRGWDAGLLEVDIDVSGAQAASQVAITVRDARAGDHRIGSVEIRADGSPATHTAHAALRSSLGDLDLELAGGMDAERWRGEFVDATLDAPGAGRWRLARAAELNVDADRIRIATTCLNSDAGGRACADFERADQARTSFDIEALPLSVLRPWLPEQSTLTGEMNAEGALSIRSGRLEGDVTASLSPGELTVTEGRYEGLAVAHADTEFAMTIDGEGAEIGFGSAIGDDGRVSGHLLVAGLDENAALDGTLEVSLPRLDPIAAFVAGPLAAEGEAFMEARIGGSVAAPRADGVARIEVNRAHVHDLGIELTDSWLEARADDGQRVAIEGMLRSGEGHLSVDGSGHLDTGGWTPGELVVTGESFEIVRLPEAVVTVSPDVTVSAPGESLAMTGRVVVPRARITPPEIAEAGVGVSSDEVLVDRTGSVAQAEAGRGPDLAADLVVALGDDVVFDGFGLISRLAGELRVRHTPGGVPAAFGALDLVDGQFMLYRQRLDIEHGRVTFAGPLNDPGLDIRAVRRAGDITAGIVIGGTVSDPESRVYSEPPLDEADAFSVLLTGRTFSNADDSESALLAQAALNLGLDGSGRIVSRVQSALGLDELRLEGIGDAGDASLILGKRLSDDIGVRYVHWLARHAGSVFVNYRLTDHLSIEAESGVRQGLDLLFSIERDDATQ